MSTDSFPYGESARTTPGGPGTLLTLAHSECYFLCSIPGAGRCDMGSRLEEALAFDRNAIQAGIDEADEELGRLRERTRELEKLIHKGRQILEGGTADLALGANGGRRTLHEAIRRVLLERDNAPA